LCEPVRQEKSKKESGACLANGDGRVGRYVGSKYVVYGLLVASAKMEKRSCDWWRNAWDVRVKWWYDKGEYVEVGSRVLGTKS